MTNEKFSLEEFERKYVARLEDRTLDWNVLKFQEEIDPSYRRAQMRYIAAERQRITMQMSLLQNISL